MKSLIFQNYKEQFMELRVTQYLSTSAASTIGIAARALYSSVMSVLGKSANKAALIQAATAND